MTKMTSAQANKTLRKLAEDKVFLLSKERTCQTYTAAEGEEPLIPEYDFNETNDAIADIDCKISDIKHALNIANTTMKIEVEEYGTFTVDVILVRLAQLNNRKAILDMMRKRQVKARIGSERYFTNRKNAVVEFEYANYSIKDAEEAYSTIDAEITALQLALDEHNNTVMFEVDI